MTKAAMRLLTIPNVFGLTALTFAGISVIGLYIFLGPHGENLSIAGVNGILHLVLFPATSALAAWFSARTLFVPRNRSSFPLNASRGFLRGLAIGAIAFLSSVIANFVVVAVTSDIEVAYWLTLASLTFGGLAFAVPGLLISGLTGILCVRHANALSSNNKR